MKRFSFVSLILLIAAGGLFYLWDRNGYPYPTAWNSASTGIDPFAPAHFQPPSFVRKLREAKELRNLRKEQGTHEKLCFRNLESFAISDLYFGCENAYDGRWYLHFRENGTIGMAMHVDGTRTYMPDDERYSPLDLSGIFVKGVTYERTGPRSIRFTSGKGSHDFDLQPFFGGNDPLNSCDRLTFQEQGTGTIRFELTLVPERWENNFQFFTETGKTL